MSLAGSNDGALGHGQEVSPAQRQGTPRAPLSSGAQHGKALSWRGARLAASQCCCDQQKGPGNPGRSRLNHLRYCISARCPTRPSHRSALICISSRNAVRHMILKKHGRLLAVVALGFPAFRVRDLLDDLVDLITDQRQPVDHESAIEIVLVEGRSKRKSHRGAPGSSEAADGKRHSEP